VDYFWAGGLAPPALSPVIRCAASARSILSSGHIEQIGEIVQFVILITISHDRSSKVFRNAMNAAERFLICGLDIDSVFARGVGVYDPAIYREKRRQAWVFGG